MQILLTKFSSSLSVLLNGQQHTGYYFSKWHFLKFACGRLIWKVVTMLMKNDAPPHWDYFEHFSRVHFSDFFHRMFHLRENFVKCFNTMYEKQYLCTAYNSAVHTLIEKVSAIPPCWEAITFTLDFDAIFLKLLLKES